MGAKPGIRLDLLHHVCQLIDGTAIRRGPGAPLFSVDGAELAALVRPFVPDAHTVLAQILDIGRAHEEPQQLVNDGFDVQLLGRDQREALRQVEAHLVAEYAQRARTRAIVLAGAVRADVAQKIEILPHIKPWRRRDCRSAAHGGRHRAS
jgi:hypothetical protein